MLVRVPLYVGQCFPSLVVLVWTSRMWKRKEFQVSVYGTFHFHILAPVWFIHLSCFLVFSITEKLICTKLLLVHRWLVIGPRATMIAPHHLTIITTSANTWEPRISNCRSSLKSGELQRGALRSVRSDAVADGVNICTILCLLCLDNKCSSGKWKDATRCSV